MLDKNYFIHLGGVIRFIEVWRNPNSTPRDKLLAKRTFQHRPVISYSEYLEQSDSLRNVDKDENNTVDQVIQKINLLRIEEKLNLNQLEILIEELKTIFYK